MLDEPNAVGEHTFLEMMEANCLEHSLTSESLLTSKGYSQIA